MKNPLALGVATLAVALSLGLAACGSDDSGDSGETLSNSELIAQADEICTSYNDQLDTLTDEATLDEGSSQGEIVAFISDEIVPLYEEQLDELKSLEPNEDDAGAYNDLTSTLESELQALKDDPEGALNSDDPFAEASTKAQDFGLEVCGSN